MIGGPAGSDTILPHVPGAINFDPLSINDKGQVVGTYEDGNLVRHGFLDSGGTYTILDVPRPPAPNALSIKDKGQIVGTYQDSNGVGHGFLYSHGTYTGADANPPPQTAPGKNRCAGLKYAMSTAKAVKVACGAGVHIGTESRSRNCAARTK